MKLECIENNFIMQSLGVLSRSGALLNSLLTSKRNFSGDLTAGRTVMVTAARTVELKILRNTRKTSGSHWT